MLLRGCLRVACWIVAFEMLAASPPESVREAATTSEELIGTAVRPHALSEPAYSTTLSHEFNMVEPEDSMKWWIVRANPGQIWFC